MMHTESTEPHTPSGPNPDMGPPLDIQNYTHMIQFANQSAAMELLLSVKSGVRNYAMALTECATPQVRDAVKNQLFQSIDLHHKVAQVMMQKGWLLPHSPHEQFALDIQSAQRTANIAKMQLFKDRSKVLATFDTPQ